MAHRHDNIQSVLFPRGKFTVAAARAWLRAHKFLSGKVHTTEKFHRFRQQPPDPRREYLLITLENGVRLIAFR